MMTFSSNIFYVNELLNQFPVANTPDWCIGATLNINITSGTNTTVAQVDMYNFHV